MVLRAEKCEERSALDLEHRARRHEVELSYERDKCAARSDASEAKIDLLTAALEDARPWYRSPFLVATISVLLTVGMIALSTWILAETSAAFRNLSATW
jgi:hypothetical protein